MFNPQWLVYALAAEILTEDLQTLQPLRPNNSWRKEQKKGRYMDQLMLHLNTDVMW